MRDMEPSFAGKVRLVMDRGFWSAANVNAMMRGHLEFPVGMPTSPGPSGDVVDARAGEPGGWGATTRRPGRAARGSRTGGTTGGGRAGTTLFWFNKN